MDIINNKRKDWIKIVMTAMLVVLSLSFMNASLHAAPIVIEDHRDHDKFETFEGKVIWVGDRQFDLRVGNVVYSVHSPKALPYKMGQGYNVKVYGEPVGEYTIRDATTVVVSDGGDRVNDEDTRHGYENIVGVVIRIQSDTDIVIRAGKKLYHVFLARRKSEELQQGDEVSVYGPRYGWNNIRSASIKIIKGNPNQYSGQF